MTQTTMDILALARGFMESRILLTAVELNLFTPLAKEPLTPQQLTQKIGADQRGLTMLLDALAAMGLLIKKDGSYRTNPSISSCLSEGTADSILPMLQHSAHLWRRWSHLTDVVAGAQITENAGESMPWTPEALEAFIGAMHVVGQPMAAQIIAAIDIGSAERLLDIGGASGTYTMAFLQSAPAMKATLFDRPDVIEMARKRLEASQLLDRVTLVAGNFYTDELPPGHDIALLSAIIHQNSPEENIQLFRKVFRALRHNGRVIIRDHVMNRGRTQPKDGAIFAINMLVGTAGGGTFTFDEIQSWLETAGFTAVRLIRDGEHMDQLVEAVKP